ncbi:hypothetical protein [Granulicoccus sp. GXG6511]|uniref:hypothetical protein n=1 Tax=Granulicoccus sp. GXG6511 TaxID=3381351 RepID=UPI003D7C6F9A
MVELRDAAVAAGYDCPEWAETNVVKLAAGSGRCSDQDVFSVYLTQQDVSTSVQNLKALGAGVHLLTGPNWIINVRPAHLEPLREKLGGTIVIAAESTR